MHRERLLRVARRRTRCEDDAQDVVAEALLRAVEHSTVTIDRLPAWLTTVTIRLCIDILRDHSREMRRWGRLEADATAGSCEQVVCDQAEAAWVATLVKSLPNRQSRVLHLRATGMDIGGIADSLGVTYRTAESLLARGRATVRAILTGSLVAAALAAWRGVRLTVGHTGAVVAAGVCAVNLAAVVAMTTTAQPPDSPTQTRAPAVEAKRGPVSAQVPEHSPAAASVPTTTAHRPDATASPGTSVRAPSATAQTNSLPSKGVDPLLPGLPTLTGLPVPLTVPPTLPAVTLPSLPLPVSISVPVVRLGSG